MRAPPADGATSRSYTRPVERACPSCGAGHPVAARFCSECGAPLTRTCSGCGSEHPAAAAFCSTCGLALGDGRPRGLGGDERQERRVVTVLFADLAGSTTLASGLDPEDVRELQGELFELIGTEVERFGGVTEKFVGDAVLAVFGIPQAHGDDAARAVRAGLAIHRGFLAFATRVRERYGADVGLRVAVNTGEVVSSREAAARGELIVSGDPVNVAARLQQGAEPGDVLVGERTWSVTRREIAYGEPRAVSAKGKSSPLRAWPALDVIDGAPSQSVAGLVAPLIGRDDELAVLSAVARRVERERTPQLVTLFGQPGVGKSRLVAEFRARLGAAAVLTGRCLPYGHGGTYWALAEAAKGHAGILDTDPAHIALEKLRTAIEPLVRTGRSGRVLDAVATTIGLTLPEASIVSLDPAEVVRRLQEAWAEYLGAQGRDTFTVLVLEDVHWASGALLDLVDHLAETLADTGVLLVCTARPELLERRPTWGAGKTNAIAQTIAPLGPDEAAQLVSSLLGAVTVPDDVSAFVLATAEGNPFFVEEMLRMLIEQGALSRRHGEWLATERLAQISIPDSVHAVVAARIDLLDAADREALRRCSVIGRVFWPAAVGVDEELVLSLGKSGLVSDRTESVMAGMREFAFKHAVTRDVAYSTLTRTERRALHRRVAEWIQSVAPDRSPETAELAAFHYGEAVALGDDDPGVRRRTSDMFLAAGTVAVDRAEFGSADTHLRRALELATDDRQRAAALLALARLEILTADSCERAIEHLDDVERLLPSDAAVIRSDALAWRSRACWMVGRWAEALGSANDAVQALAGLPESPQLARALARRSQIEMLRSAPEAAAHGREAVAVARRVGDAFAEVNARINVFTFDAMNGVAPDPAEVLEIVRAAVEARAPDEAYRAIVNFVWSAAGYLHVREIEHTTAQARSQAGSVGEPLTLGTYLELSLAAMLLVPAGRWREADDALTNLDEPHTFGVSSRLVWLGLVAGLALRRGDLAGAERLLDELRPAALATGEPQRIIPMACVALPWAAVSGERELVRSWAREVLAAVDGRWSSVLTCLPVVRAIAAAGEVELLARTAESLRPQAAAGGSSLATSHLVAQALLGLAAGRPREAAAQFGEAADRERDLGNVFHAACVDLDLARALEAAGDPAGASAVLGRAASVLDALGCVNPY